MKKLLAAIISVTLSMFPFAVYALDTGQQASKPPPVSQELVSEGDFAFELASALKLGTPATEAQAEDMLTAAGIAPKNGWIADYPMTPIVVGEVQNAVIAAAATKKLSMEREEALQAFQGLTSQFSLAIAPATGKYAETQAPTSSEYVEPSAVENYYAEEGPPVVTYYPPPPDYGYLYSWVPYPFWWTGFFFPGFFVLNDFDNIVVGDHFGHHHHDDHDFDHHGHDFDHRITNHFNDPRTHQVMRVDPTTRTGGFSGSVTHTAAFNSPGARRGAASIMNRSFETARSRGLTGTTGRSFGSVPRTTTTPRATNGRTFNASPRSFGRSSEGFGRSFSSPMRSFSLVPMTGRSFSGGSREFHGGGFGGFHGGGFSGGFHGGGRR